MRFVLVFILSSYISLAFAAPVSRANLMLLAERSASVEVARARLASAEVSASAAGLGLSGSLSGSAAVNGTTPNPNYSYPWDIQFNIRFAGVWGEAQDARVQAGLSLERAKRGLVAARVRAVSNAVILWHGLRRGLATLETARLNLELAILEDRAAEAKFRAGGISLSDRERVGLALDIAGLEVSRAEIRVDGVRLQLEALFGLRDTTISSGWTVLPEPSVTDLQLEAREDVFEARAAFVSADLQRNQAGREVLPTLNLEASLRGSAGALNLSVNQYLALSVGYSYPVILPVGTTSFSIGLSLRIPLDPFKFSFLGTSTQQLSAAQRALETALATARADVSSKRMAIALTRSNLQLTKRSAEFANRQLEYIRKKAEAGSASVLEVKRAELDTLKANSQILDAQADLDSALLELYNALALPLEAQ
jgi:outer membrane protein TolC